MRRGSPICWALHLPNLPLFALTWSVGLERYSLELGSTRRAVHRKDGHLVPVAIELWHLESSSPNGKTTVYTPANSHEKASCPSLPRASFLAGNCVWRADASVCLPCVHECSTYCEVWWRGAHAVVETGVLLVRHLQKQPIMV